jgi:hypothetical protein
MRDRETPNLVRAPMASLEALDDVDAKLADVNTAIAAK